jgi:dTDP-4-amino-4,6-dideoxygalactose transaminase
MRIPLIKPYITQEVKDKVWEVLDNGYLTEGAVTKELEDSFKEYVGCKYALAVCNCTVGLEMALRAMGIGPGNEVIVPDYTYPATASVVEIVGAKIVIVDVDPESMLIDYDAVENSVTEKTKAVIPVSIFGNPLNYERLEVIKSKYNIHILEDAACSIGAQYDGRFVGNLADISVFSMHPRKFITTGEGGMITTNNAKWAEWMDSYKHFGMGKHDSRVGTRFNQIGTNYKLSNIQAAVGVVQMNHIEQLLNKRRELASNYMDLISEEESIRFQKIIPQGTHSYQSFCVLLDNRDGVIEVMRKRGIEVQIGTYSLHQHEAFSNNPNCQIVGDLQGSRYAFDHCLTLPMYHEMTKDEQEYVVEELIKLL